MSNTLAIDLSLRKSGWVVLGEDEGVQDHGIIVCTGGRVESLAHLAGELEVLLRSFCPDTVIVEVPIWTRGSLATSTIAMEALHAAWTIVEMQHYYHSRRFGRCRLEKMDPSVAKEALTRDRHGSKADVRRSLSRQGFEVDGLGEDECDALGVGVTWLRTVWAAEKMKEEINGHPGSL